MAKNKLAKFADMETFSNVYQPRHEEVFRQDHPLKGQWNTQVFRNTHPLVLEIGCGKGEYTTGLAGLYPEKNFIGLDVKGARMWHGAKTALEKQLPNAAFLRLHAEMLTSVFAPDEISEIWITFPDPQMAKSRKRLTGSRFLMLYKQVLRNEGIVHLKTDSPFLYAYTSELIRKNQLPVFIRTEDLYSSQIEDRILGIKTFYEQQWLLRGKKIKYLQFSLTDKTDIAEPDIEPEKDDYHSEARYMNANLKL